MSNCDPLLQIRAGTSARQTRHINAAPGSIPMRRALEGTYVPGRSSSDADVIVAPADAEKTVKALQARGWSLVIGYRDGTDEGGNDADVWDIVCDLPDVELFVRLHNIVEEVAANRIALFSWKVYKSKARPNCIGDRHLGSNDGLYVAKSAGGSFDGVSV